MTSFWCFFMVKFEHIVDFEEINVSWVVSEWNNVDPDIHSSTSCNLLRNTLTKFIRPAQRNTFSMNDSLGIILLTRMRLGFSQLHEHKFGQGFRDTSNPPCPCSFKPKTATHYFLRHHFYNANRTTLMNELNKTSSSFANLNDKNLLTCYCMV